MMDGKRGIEAAFQAIIAMVIGIVVVIVLIAVFRGQAAKVPQLSGTCGQGVYSDYSSTCYQKTQPGVLCLPVAQSSCTSIKDGKPDSPNAQVYCCKQKGG